MNYLLIAYLPEGLIATALAGLPELLKRPCYFTKAIERLSSFSRIAS